jgi:hypothetical protein
MEKCVARQKFETLTERFDNESRGHKQSRWFNAETHRVIIVSRVIIIVYARVYTRPE